MQISPFSPFSPEYIRIDRTKEDAADASRVDAGGQGGNGGQVAPSDAQNGEEMRIAELRQADAEVRAHEAAHLAAGGGVVTGGANFTYTKGPDGRMYATAGEVPIDASEESTPEGTLQKARQIAAAAMAPADPSPTDYRVAASAVVMEMRARMEIVKEQMELLEGSRTYGLQTTPSGPSDSGAATDGRNSADALIDPAA